MKRTMTILLALCAALLMTAAVWADDIFSGTENTIAITISADDAEKLSDPETTDSFTALFNINGAAFDGTIRRATKDDMPEPGDRPEGEPPEGGEHPEGEKPEGMPEPPADGEKPEGEPPEDMPEMISYVITIDGTDYMIQGMPEMPADGKDAPEKPADAPEKPADAPEKPADAPDMPEQIGGTLSINGENKGNINIISLAK